MSKVSPQERDEQVEAVRWMIDNGRVRNWTQLGEILGVSRQAAQARFGPKGYGLTMPTNDTEKLDKRIYLGLSSDLLARLQHSAGDESQRQSYIRQLLDQHLPPLTPR